MRRLANLPVALAAILMSVAAPALAHTVLMEPEPRVTGMTGSGLKERHCGEGALDRRSDTVTTYTAGDTITVKFWETIPHPGYFRISFDADGQDDFVDPPTPRATGYSAAVLADVIYPSTPAEASQRWGQENTYEFQVTLPDVACDRCTLQMIQFMEDKLADGDPDNDIYYSCADLVLLPRALPYPGPADEGPMPDEALPDVAAGEPGLPGEDAGGDTGAVQDVPGTPDAGTDSGVTAEPSGGSSGGCSAGAAPSSVAGAVLLVLAGLGRFSVRRRRS